MKWSFNIGSGFLLIVQWACCNEMSSLLDDRNKQIQKANQKTNDLIDLVSFHHLLAVAVSSLPSSEGAEERKRLAALQMKIETAIFDILKATKVTKKTSEAKGDDNKPGTGFTLLCNNLRETVELFRRDLYKLIFIQHGLANGSSGFLMWDGVSNGFHCSAILHENTKFAKLIGNFKDNGKTHDTRMEDIAQKISVILKALISGILQLIRNKLKMIIGIAAFALLALILGMVAITFLVG